MGTTLLWTLAGLGVLAALFFWTLVAVNPSDEKMPRPLRDWRPTCKRCGERYSPEPCCEGPCAHEVEASGLCMDCEIAVHHEYLSTPCSHGRTIGDCVDCYVAEFKED